MVADPVVDRQSETFRSLRRLNREFHGLVEGLAATCGLTAVQFRLMRRIPDEGIPMTRLAGQTHVDPGNVSSTIDRLEREGLVRREHSSEDRRVVVVRLTDTGRGLVDRLVPGYRDLVREAMVVLSPGEVDSLSEILDKLHGRVSELTNGGSEGRKR